VEAHSEGRGRGSEFRVRLPAFIADASGASSPAQPAASFRPRRVLVIDDNQDAAEWGGRGVRVNAVCPGWTETEMAAPALTEPGRLERITQTMPLRKVAQPDDVAWQVVVLASDRLSGHVSGQVIVVAGGMEGRLLHEA
jgi:hypothetical protein